MGRRKGEGGEGWLSDRAVRRHGVERRRGGCEWAEKDRMEWGVWRRRGVGWVVVEWGWVRLGGMGWCPLAEHLPLFSIFNRVPISNRRPIGGLESGLAAAPLVPLGAQQMAVVLAHLVSALPTTASIAHLSTLPTPTCLRLLSSLSSHVAAALNAVVHAPSGTRATNHGVAASLVTLLTGLLRCRRDVIPDGVELTSLLKPAILGGLQLMRRAALSGGGIGADAQSADTQGGSVAPELMAQVVDFVVERFRIANEPIIAMARLSDQEVVRRFGVEELLYALTLPVGLRSMPLLMLPAQLAAAEALTPALYAALAPGIRIQVFSALCAALHQRPALSVSPLVPAARRGSVPEASPAEAAAAAAHAAATASASLQRVAVSLPLEAETFAAVVYAAVDAGRKQTESAAAAQGWMGCCGAALEVLSAQGVSATAAVPALVPPLVELLRLLWHGHWAGGEADDAEYLAQLVLCALCDATMRLTTTHGSCAPEEGSEAATVAKMLQMPLIIRHLHARPRVATDALRLVQLGAALLPTAALEELAPLLASSSERALQPRRALLGGTDDTDGGVEVAQRAIAALLPLLLQRGLQLRPLLRKWTRLVLRHPSSRWRPLLRSLLDAMTAAETGDQAAAEHLHCCLLLLVCPSGIAADALSTSPESGRHSDSVSAAAEKAELQQLAHMLCNGAPPQVQLQLCSLMVSTAQLVCPPTSESEIAGSVPTAVEMDAALFAFVQAQLGQENLREKAAASANQTALEAAAHELFHRSVSPYAQSAVVGRQLWAARAHAWRCTSPTIPTHRNAPTYPLLNASAPTHPHPHVGTHAPAPTPHIHAHAPCEAGK